MAYSDEAGKTPFIKRLDGLLAEYAATEGNTTDEAGDEGGTGNVEGGGDSLLRRLLFRARGRRGATAAHVDRVANELASGLVELAQPLVAGHEPYVGRYVTRGAHIELPIAALDEWLTLVDNRPSPTELENHLAGFLTNAHSTDTGRAHVDAAATKIVADERWGVVRGRLADSVVAATITAEPIEERQRLLRLLLVAGLIEALAADDKAIKTADDVHALLRHRIVVLPKACHVARRRRTPSYVVRMGFDDLEVVRDEWACYVAGEIAHIENVLLGEKKTRVHSRLDESETTRLDEAERATRSEQDLQSTDRFELASEASSETSLAAAVEGQIDTSGQYGPTKVDTHLGGSLNFSKSDSQREATTIAREVVARAASRIEERTRQQRTVRSLTRIEEINKHLIDNAEGGKGHIAGVYRWVDKIQRLQIFTYRNRFLLEFEIPEPAAYVRWLARRYSNSDLARPLPFTTNGEAESSVNPVLTAADIAIDPLDSAFYLKLGARYHAVGLKPPPSAVTRVRDGFGAAVTTALDKAQPTSFYPGSAGATKFQLDVPRGYEATTWNAVLTMWANQYHNPSATVSLIVGQEHAVVAPSGNNPLVGPFATSHDMKGSFADSARPRGTVPIAVMTDAVRGFTANIELGCVRTDEGLLDWQLETYEALVSVYERLDRDYEGARSARAAQGIPIAGESSGRNKEVSREELKRQVIEMLVATDFRGRNALLAPGNGQMPETNLPRARDVASEIQFLEQAFEWANLTYVMYPYFWADQLRWDDLQRINDADHEFSQFLRAGSARVVVPVRPGFPTAALHYLVWDEPWNGESLPIPDDDPSGLYVSVAKEIEDLTRGPDDFELGESWEVRLPTTLVYLDPSAHLPLYNGAIRLSSPADEDALCTKLEGRKANGADERDA